MKTYFLKKSRKRWVNLVGFAFVIIILFIMYLFIKNMSAFTMILFIPPLLAAVIAFRSRNTRYTTSLGISETDIVYNLGFTYIQAKWTDVTAIESIKSWTGYQDCLVGTANYKLKLPKHVSQTNELRNFEMTPRKFIIPLDIFADNWRDSELGQQIKQYAPQLFSSVEN